MGVPEVIELKNSAVLFSRQLEKLRKDVLGMRENLIRFREATSGERDRSKLDERIVDLNEAEKRLADARAINFMRIDVPKPLSDTQIRSVVMIMNEVRAILGKETVEAKVLAFKPKK